MSTLYEEMAQTCVDLMEEFGLTINIVRPSYNFDNATNKPASGGVATHPTAGIFTKIDRMPVSGTRVQHGERLMALVPTFRPQMGDRVDVSMTGDSTATTTGAAPGIILSQGQAGAWTIQEIQEINPAGTPVVFFVRVSR